MWGGKIFKQEYVIKTEIKPPQSPGNMQRHPQPHWSCVNPPAVGDYLPHLSLTSASIFGPNIPKYSAQCCICTVFVPMNENNKNIVTLMSLTAKCDTFLHSELFPIYRRKCFIAGALTLIRGNRVGVSSHLRCARCAFVMYQNFLHALLHLL